MSEHTPGPWTATVKSVYAPANRGKVAETRSDYRSKEEAEANARLPCSQGAEAYRLARIAQAQEAIAKSMEARLLP